VCDHTYLYYGPNCDRYSPLVPFVWGVLTVLHIALSICAFKVFYIILTENGQKLTMPVTVAFFVFFSCVGMAIAEASTVIRIMIKSLFLQAKLSNSFGLILSGTCMILGLLNMCLYWIELGTRSRPNPNIVGRSRRVVGISAAAFFVPSICYYAATLDVTFPCGLTSLYALAFIFFFSKGRAVIFQALPAAKASAPQHLCNWILLFYDDSQKIVPLPQKSIRRPRQEETHSPRLNPFVTETLQNIDSCTKGLSVWLAVYVLSAVFIVSTSVNPEVGAFTLVFMYLAPFSHSAVCAQVLGHLTILSSIKRSNVRRYVVAAAH